MFLGMDALLPFFLLVQQLFLFHCLGLIMAAPAMVFVRLVHLGIHDLGVVVQLPPS
jgi:hypothetical protein